ncbi:Vps62-related protein [Streptomyces sp. NRRL F-4474]|uniref:Vps62-related protein n=1 Tax=Streptomyces sp. NRRL F-4474 TaxID=1463851 RepID=UPI00131C0B86|nr:Vps62-related protein [Streptomyces sp. NRRL F-4474]
MTKGDVVEKSMVFGELELAFTDQYSWRWDDEDTGGKHWVSFWHPKPPQGFHALGTVALPAWGSDNLNPKTPNTKVKEHVVSLCVKNGPAQASEGKKPPLAHPEDYAVVWKDVGSGGKHYGACWRPVAPGGYVALGCVMSENTYDKPALTDVVCVREDLTHMADLKWIYEDKGTSAKDYFSVWANQVPPAYQDGRDGGHRALVAPNTFTAASSWDEPSRGAPERRVLCIEMPVEEKPHPDGFPKLTGRVRPADRTPETTVNVVWVPFMAVKDDDKSASWKLANSPFYRIERRASWYMHRFSNNTTSASQSISETVTVGVEKDRSDTFSAEVGISVSAQVGVSSGVASASVTTTYSLALGYSRSTATKNLEHKSVTHNLTVPPNKAAAMWVGDHTIQVTRQDGTHVGTPLTFHGDSTHFDEFPD